MSSPGDFYVGMEMNFTDGKTWIVESVIGVNEDGNRKYMISLVEQDDTSETSEGDEELRSLMESKMKANQLPIEVTDLSSFTTDASKFT
jgi:hypothetical protein